MVIFLISAIIATWGMLAVFGWWLGLFFPGWRRPCLVGLGAVLLTVFILTGMFITRSYYGTFAPILYHASHLLFAFAFVAFCVSVAGGVLFLLLKCLRVKARSHLGWLSIILISILFGCGLWGGFSSPAIKRVPITRPDFPTLKIAVISDSHLGLGVSYGRWDKALSLLEEEKPDILLVLGDVFEYGKNAEKYAARLAAFATPLGTYGVLGNHEYYNGYQQALDFFKQANITLLQNEMIALDNGLQIAGLKDIRPDTVSKQDLTNLLATADPEKPLILLSHKPLYAQEAATGGVDLMLSGHTHNGQIWPFNYLVKLRFPHIYGLFDVDGMSFYITSGMFYWGMPLRLFSPSELPIIEVNL